MTTNVQVNGRVKSGSSSMPALAFLAGWLIPGAGHLIQGKWVRALLLFLSIMTMFFVGIGFIDTRTDDICLSAESEFTSDGVVHFNSFDWFYDCCLNCLSSSWHFV